MAAVSFEASIAWNYGLPPFLPGQSSNIGAAVVTTDPTAWTLNWAGPATFPMQVVLLGSGLTGAVGATLPDTGTITSFRIVLNGYGQVFDISGLSLTAAEFQAAWATNRLGEVLLGGDDVFSILPNGSPFGDNLRLRGFDGNDRIDLSAVSAFTGVELLGDAGDDTLVGNNIGFNADTLDGGTGDDLLQGMAGGDLMMGGADEDRLQGGDGADTLTGGTGRDILRGDGGNDLVVMTVDSHPEGEILDGGAGSDLLSLGGTTGTPPVVDLSASLVTGFERLELFLASGLMTQAQYLQFGQFDLYGPVSLIFADGGFIQLGERAWFGNAGAGVVRVVGSEFADTILGRGFVDIATGGAPSGTTALNANDVIDGAGGNDRIFGAAGKDTLVGGSGNDTLRGEAGDDRCDGGTGNDVLVGGRGADVLIGGLGSDTASYETASVGLRVQLGSSALNSGDAIGDTFASVENLRGSAQGDTLLGNGGDNRIEGIAGADWLYGDAGNDSLLGGTGRDSLVGGAGLDVLTGGTDADVFAFATFGDSAVAAPDVVLDFAPSVDKISVASVIAGVFAYNSTSGFSGGGKASLYYAASGGHTDVFLDVGDDGAAEMVIRLAGTLVLVEANFIL